MGTARSERYGQERAPRLDVRGLVSDAAWADTGTAPGGWLRIAGNALAGQQRGVARFVDDAGHLALIALQKPMRVAVHAASLVAAG